MTLFLPSQGGIMPMSSSIWTDALELCCCRRLLRVPWITRRSNQSILKKINPEYSLEGLMLKLKLQYFVYLMQTAESLEKTLMLGKIEGRKTKGRQRVRWFNDIIGSMGMSLNKVWEVVKNKGAWHAAVHGIAKSWTWLSDWTTRLFLNCPSSCVQFSLSEESDWAEAFSWSGTTPKWSMWFYLSVASVLGTRCNVPSRLQSALNTGHPQRMFSFTSICSFQFGMGWELRFASGASFVFKKLVSISQWEARERWEVATN